MIRFVKPVIFLGFATLLGTADSQAQTVGSNRVPGFYLIAHRGGIVDSSNAENSLPALEGAIRRGYDMVEMDMRITKDRVLIINHDRNFKRYYGVDTAVADMYWPRIQQLRSARGSGVLSLDQVFARCREGHMQVMLDTKFEGYDTAIFGEVLRLLKKYGLQEQALMIGTDSCTSYFTGKVRLSCTRKQLEENSHKTGYDPGHYYLFGGVKDLSAADLQWAEQEGIMVVAAVNIFSYHQRPEYLQEAARDIDTLKARGVRRFQIDSNFDGAFFSSAL